ncbi:MAG: hypothetical protein KF842_06940 [Caulobacter sp.]|nr:hypothetical protein [Caulobacter sp.]
MSKPLPPEINDLARIYALEHMVTTLWSFHAFEKAAADGRTNEEVALDLASGIQGTVVDAGGMPVAFRDLMRDHVRKLMDRVVENARLADSLGVGKR